MNFALLTVYADLVDDLEASRIATDNRLRALREVKGLADTPEEKKIKLIADHLKEAEGKAITELQKAVRAHPLGPWVTDQLAIGEKTVGRLLGTLGDPYYRIDPETGEAQPRQVSQLWSYAGYGDASVQYRRRGEKANWNAKLKKLTFVIAETAIKHRKSPYRKVYDEAREKYKEAKHASDCRRCGPSGEPAQPGSPLSDGHKHSRALRAVSKDFLKNLWIESRRLHESEGS